jgi:predicted RNA-binding Zn ribbon-like protein
MSVSSPDPPHGLQLVIDFVNTRDLELGTDELETPAGLLGWLRDRGVGGVSAGDLEGPLREAQRVRAVALREALRAALLAHSGGGPDAKALAELEGVAERGRLSVRFHPDGTVDVAPRAPGFAGSLARLLVPISAAAADGTWGRVKACRADDCRWAFYDHSRNRSGRWCDMAVCGNRTKVRTYRAKDR